VFGVETALAPRFARAQRRYLGASGSADPADLRGSIPATIKRCWPSHSRCARNMPIPSC